MKQTLVRRHRFDFEMRSGESSHDPHIHVIAQGKDWRFYFEENRLEKIKGSLDATQKSKIRKVVRDNLRLFRKEWRKRYGVADA